MCLLGTHVCAYYILKYPLHFRQHLPIVDQQMNRELKLILLLHKAKHN